MGVGFGVGAGLGGANTVRVVVAEARAGILHICAGDDIGPYGRYSRCDET